VAKIDLKYEKKQDMITAIQTYFQNERDEELGDLAANLILDFFIENLAAEFYNQGVFDAYSLMNEKIEDILDIQKF